MRGASHTPGGNESSFTDGALSLLRNSVGSVSKDYKKAAKPSGKAFQTAHDSSGWDRKARWQRAFNLAKSKMGVDGIEESVDKWGAGSRDADGGDHRSASAQPARRGSTIGIGGALAGTQGTIAELRTPVALKEHLKRGKGARELGIQLVALEDDLPISEQDVAALVAQFDQRRQMLGAAPSPGRPALKPADRALKAWTNNNYNSNTISNNSNFPGSDRVGSSSSSLASNAGNSYSESTPSTAMNGGSTGPKVHSSSFAATAAATAAGFNSPGCRADSATVGGSVVASSLVVSPSLMVVDSATTNRSVAIVNDSNSTAAASTGAVGDGAIGGFMGVSGGSFSGTGSAGVGVRLERRLSENGGLANAWAAGSGGDSSVAPFRRNTGVGPESIIARQPQVMQRGESGSLSRLTQDNSAALRSLASPEATAQPIRVSLSGQDSGALASGASISVMGGINDHQGGWLHIPLTSSVDTSGGGIASGALRPTPRPSSAGRRGAQSQIWPPVGTVTAILDLQAVTLGSCGGAASGESSGPVGSAASPFTSPASAPIQLHSQRQSSSALVALQMPPPAAESSLSPPHLPVSRSTPSGVQSSSAAAGGSNGFPGGLNCVEGEPNVGHLISPSADSAAPSSPGLHMAVTSPIGTAAAAAVASTGVNLMPLPPATSVDSSAVFSGGLRRPRLRVSIAGDACPGANTILQGTASGPSQGGWIPADGCANVDNAIVLGTTATAATAAGPPASPRLIMHTSPASSSSPTRPSVTAPAPGYRRSAASSPGINHRPGAHHPSPPAPALTSSSPPVTLRPHALGQPSTPIAQPPTSPPSTGGTYRRVSITGSSGILSGGLTRTVVTAPQPYSNSPPQAHASPLQFQQPQQQIQPSVSTAPVWQTSLRPMGAAASPRGRVADDGSETTLATSLSAGVRVVAASNLATNAAARTTPVSDAVLAGLRVVATEVADELSREAEVAALSRQALAQRSRMRMSDSGKPRHISLPGDPWRKWG